MCQTHRRQFLETGEVKPIRPYRPRQPGTAKFAGLRLSTSCIELIEEKIQREGLAQGAAIAQIVEEWAQSKARGPRG